MTAGKNRFAFVACCYNMANTLPRMLYSLAAQSHPDWRLVLVDDVSDRGQQGPIADHVARFNELMRWTHGDKTDRITLILNSEKKWETANVLHVLSLVEPDEVACRIDADDYLVDSDALVMIDQAYQQTGCDVLWTKHRWGFSDKNISGPMPSDADPYKFPWVSSHMKTFRRSLLDGIADANFRGEDGGYVRRAGDQALFLPLLHDAKKRVFLDRVTYHYKIDDVPETYQTDDAKFQRDEALFLRARGYVR